MTNVVALVYSDSLHYILKIRPLFEDFYIQRYVAGGGCRNIKASYLSLILKIYKDRDEDYNYGNLQCGLCKMFEDIQIRKTDL